MAYGMLFLLHLLLGAILKGPLDDVGLMRGTLDMMALLKLCPEVMKVLELDQMPDLGERGSNDGGFCDRGRSGDAARHVCCLLFVVLRHLLNVKSFSRYEKERKG